MLHHKLKEETKHDHAQLEKKLLGRIATIKNVSDYVSLLDLFYGYYSEIEKPIDQYLNNASFPDMPLRRKSEIIKSDIEQLLPASPAGPVCLKIPIINSATSALGALYVLEGSTLGGTVVARIISGKLQSDTGFAFLLNYGSNVTSMWNAFQAYLARPWTSEQQLEIIASAKNTFATFNYWLSSHEE